MQSTSTKCYCHRHRMVVIGVVGICHCAGCCRCCWGHHHRAAVIVEVVAVVCGRSLLVAWHNRLGR